ncbi:MAG: hypothetical protein ACD_11C00017G0021 [uncultured bacterium]|nr:MAG: hypothetical protein ACD_11C00017G0021 [uncultured bacterium]HBR71509.1 rod shape-determining protein MreD [Candidatus Moranbacteria bacterium]
MKKFFVYFAIMLVSLSIQTSAVPLFFSFGHMPDFVLMLVLAWAIIDGFNLFFWWAVFLGILYDLISFSFVGSYAIIFILLVYGVSFLSKRFRVEMNASGMVVIYFLVLLSTIGEKIMLIFYNFGIAGIGSEFSNFFPLIKSLTIISMYNFIFFFFWFFVIKKIKKYFLFT